MTSAIVVSNHGANDAWMSVAEFLKSSTRTSSCDFSGGRIRFSRDSVCTAATPVSFLSTYIADSSGWSNPVWYLSATTSSRYSCSCERPAPATSSARTYANFLGS